MKPRERYVLIIDYEANPTSFARNIVFIEQKIPKQVQKLIRFLLWTHGLVAYYSISQFLDRKT
jgi:hypothetical protein